MLLLFVLSILLSVASAQHRVTLAFTLDPGRNLSSLVLYLNNGGVLMGRCGRRINTRVPIDFSKVTVNVDDEGRVPPYGNYNETSSFIIPVTSGNFTVGNDTYAIHPNPTFSGGPSCITDVDTINNRIFIYCRRLYWDYTDVIEDPNTVETDCFGPFPPVVGPNEMNYYKKEEEEELKKKRVLKPKIGRRCPPKKDDVNEEKDNKIPPNLEGSGWPHQRYLLKQVSTVLYCGKNQTCNTCKSEAETHAFGTTSLWNIGINFGIGIADIFKIGADTGFTYGFSITDSWTVTDSYGCDGNPGDTVCVWYKVAHTAFTIRQKNPRNDWKQNVVASPNRHNQGGGYICKYNKECRSKGSQYWDCYGRQDAGFRYCPPPGHPPKLRLDSGPLPQDRELAAITTARLKRKKMIIAEGGEDAWKDYERKEKEVENKLKMKYDEKWASAIEQEQQEMNEMRKQEAKAERERKGREKAEKATEKAKKDTE